jgi:putative ABC transport system permease protein
VSLRALWFRPLLERPVRFVATVLGVAVGVSSLVSTVLASRAAVASLNEDVGVLAGRAVLEVRAPGGVRLDDLDGLRELAGEAVFAPVVEEVAHSPGLGDVVRVLGVDLFVDGEVRDLELVPGPEGEGAALDRLLGGQGVALSRGLAAGLGVGPGDPLPLVVDSRPVELEVAALVEPARFASAWERVLVVDVATAQELFGRSDLDRLEVLPRHELDASELAARIAARLPETYRVGPASDRQAEGEELVAALEFNLTALSGVSLLVGLVLVATTLATSVVQRRQSIALLRSLGASRGQLAGALLGEAAAIGVLGGAGGALLGWAAARGAVQSVRVTMASVTPTPMAGEIALEPRWLLLGIGVGLGASLVAALLPLREALSVPPIQGLRRERPESVVRREWPRQVGLATVLLAGAGGLAALPPVDGRPLFALASALLLLATLLVLAAPLVDLGARLHLGSLAGRASTSLRVAQAALAAGRRRAAWAAGAVGVAVGLAVAMSTMVDSFRGSVVAWTDQTMRSDLFVRPFLAESGVTSGQLAPEVARVAREVFGEEGVDAFHQADAWFRGEKVLLGGGEFEVVARFGGVPDLEGRDGRPMFARALETGGAVVNEPFARRFGVAVGDTLELDTGAGRIERVVAGVYRDYSGHTGRVVLDRDDFLDAYPETTLQSLAIFLPADADVRAERERFLAAVDGRYRLDCLLNREVREEVLTLFDRTFAVTIALQLLAVVVAAIAVVTVLGSLVWERRKDLAVVRVLGGSPVQVAAVVLIQALLLGAAGALGGLAVGLAVGWVLVEVVNPQSFGWTLSFDPPWGTLASTALLVLPASALAALVPALFAIRKPPREALRDLG